VSLRRTVFAVLVAVPFSGCGGQHDAPVKREQSYQSLAKADEAFAAKKYADAIPIYDVTLAKGGVQADVLAQAYLKRAVCKIETGDLAGAEADLSMADQGGAVGDDYTEAQKRLKEKSASR